MSLAVKPSKFSLPPLWNSHTCRRMTLTFDPVTLKSFSTVPTHMLNTHAKFPWHPSAKYREIRVNGHTTAGRRAYKKRMHSASYLRRRRKEKTCSWQSPLYSTRPLCRLHAVPHQAPAGIPGGTCTPSEAVSGSWYLLLDIRETKMLRMNPLCVW